MGREHQRLLTVVDAARRLERTDSELAGAQELAQADDAEMVAEARAETTRLSDARDRIFEELKPLLVPDDPLNDRPAIDTLILGCTHYPLLRGVLERAVGDEVCLVDSAEVTAEAVGAAFAQPGPSGNGFIEHGRVVHFVTGDPRAFAHTAGVIGGVGGEIIPLPVTELATAAA